MKSHCSIWDQEGQVAACPQTLHVIALPDHVTESGAPVTGGRASSRPVEGYTFDHAAQFVAAGADEAFAKVLERWLLDGVVQPWEGRFGLLRCSGTTTFFVPSKEVTEEDHPGYVVCWSLETHLDGLMRCVCAKLYPWLSKMHLGPHPDRTMPSQPASSQPPQQNPFLLGGTSHRSPCG